MNDEQGDEGVENGRKKTGFLFCFENEILMRCELQFLRKVWNIWVSKWTKMKLYYSSKVDAC